MLPPAAAISVGSQSMKRRPAVTYKPARIIRECLNAFRETSAYDRLSKEAGSLADRFVEDTINTAHEWSCRRC